MGLTEFTGVGGFKTAGFHTTVCRQTTWSKYSFALDGTTTSCPSGQVGRTKLNNASDLTYAWACHSSAITETASDTWRTCTKRAGLATESHTPCYPRLTS